MYYKFKDQFETDTYYTASDNGSQNGEQYGSQTYKRLESKTQCTKQDHYLTLCNNIDALAAKSLNCT